MRAPTAKAGRESRRRLPRLFSSVAPELATAGGARPAHIELLFWGVRPYRGRGVDHCLLLPLELAQQGRGRVDMVNEALHGLVQQRLRRISQRYTNGRREVVELLADAGHPVSIEDMGQRDG